MAETLRRGSIKRMPGKQLHAIAGKLRKETWEGEDLSEAQVWLFSAVVTELERRHRRARTIDARCWCDLCRNPFDPGRG